MIRITKKSILKKTAEVGSATLFSRIIGLIRTMLMSRYLGVGIESDAFWVAYKIPNFLRKIFAEGALSAAFVPSMVNLVEKDKNKDSSSRLMSLAFIFFESLLALICIIMISQARQVLLFIAPGFKEQIEIAVPFLQIFSIFILFISSSALLKGALDAVNHFFVPSFAPVVMNIIIVIALLLAIALKWPTIYICYAFLVAAFINFVMHLIIYYKKGFGFYKPNKLALINLYAVIKRFLPILFGMSIIEINLLIDARFASGLAQGSYTLIEYASRFMQIPLGVFATAFATILFPHFGRVSAYAPKRLMFYLFEATKIIIWVMLPMSLIMAFFAKDIFANLMFKSSDLIHVSKATHVLWAFLVGLIFFSLNKIILNIYYAIKANWLSVWVLIISTMLNIILNQIFMKFIGAPGLALATSISATFQTFLLCYILKRFFKFSFPFSRYANFILKIILNNIIIIPVFLILYYSSCKLIIHLNLKHILLETVYVWLWLIPLNGLIAFLYIILRKPIGLKLYFLDE